jgi:holo-[acyl-carrier protein] synthase
MLVSGVDLVEIARVEAALRRYGPRFLARVFTPAEVAYAGGRADQLATRFAAKEAAAKALGCGLTALAGGGVAWREIEVLPGPGGRPALALHGAAAAQAAALGVRDCALSLSHTRELAVAFVVMSG